MLTAARLFVAAGAHDVLAMATGALRLFSLTYVTRWWVPWRAPRWACDACAAVPPMLYF